MTLGQRLYDMRKAKGLSQEKVAEILGVTRQTVSKWETDQTTPDFDKIVPLCSLYDISTQELLTGEKEAQPEKSSSNTDNYGNYYSNNSYNGYENPPQQDENQGTYSYEPPTDYNDTNTIEFKAKQKRKFALLLSLAIFLYILSPVPFFFSGELGSSAMLALFFVIIATATMIIVFASASKIKYNNSNDNKNITKEDKLYKQIIQVLSSVILVIYLLISFLTHAWNITWILWIVYALLCQVIKLIFSLKGVTINESE